MADLTTIPRDGFPPLIERSWRDAGLNSVAPEIYLKYLFDLYGVTSERIRQHRFFSHLSTALSFTPFASDKILWLYRRYKAGLPIARLELDLTDRCNFRCPGCTFQFAMQDTELRYSALFEVITQLKKHRITTITLAGGGDPTQFGSEQKRLVDVTTLLHAHGIRLFVITNLYSAEERDLEVLLETTDAIRVSYYPRIAAGEPANKNEVVLRNIRRLLQLREQSVKKPWVIVGTLLPYAGEDDLQTSLDLSQRLGIPVTPRPYLAIRRTAYAGLSEETLERVLDQASVAYEHTVLASNLQHSLGMREYLERLFAYSLPLPRHCIVTEQGLVGKLRANGDLFSCGQLSAVPRTSLDKAGLGENTLYQNIYSEMEGTFEEHAGGRSGLTQRGCCPTCRETMNNLRISRFGLTLTPEAKVVLAAMDKAFSGGGNLANFW